MINLKKKTTSLLVGIIIVDLLLLAGYYYFFTTIKNTNEQISSLSQQIEIEGKSDVQTGEINSVVKNSTLDRQKLDSYFVKSGGAVDFLKSIEDLASLSGLSHSTESVNDEADSVLSTTNKAWLHIVIDTGGNWQNTYHFMSLIDNLPYAVKIDKISLNLVSDGGPIGDASSSATSAGSRWQGVFDFKTIILQ